MCKNKIKAKYELAKAAKVGDIINCPSCNTPFEKTHYQQAFCKTKGKTKCKDKYWNTVTPEKRNNTTRISPASAAWLNATYGSDYNLSQRQLDIKDRRQLSLEADISWDEHQCHVERCQFCECIVCRCAD